MNFAITTLGCKVNQYESNALTALLRDEGFVKIDSLYDADIVIINSCTVTENSDRKVRQLIKTIREKKPSAIIILIGCFVQAFPDKAHELGVEIVTGTSDKKSLPRLIKEFLKTAKSLRHITPTTLEYEEIRSPISDLTELGDRTRVNIKIEDGCDRNCTYCIIPTARGRVRSRNMEDIIKEAERVSDGGGKEIVLTGINLSCFGQDSGQTLYDVVRTVSKIKGLERIRLSSLEPDMITVDDIKRLSDIETLCPHFHLSLQSGCDETLKRMNRLYSAKEYKNIVNTIEKYFDNPAITTDVMVGFVGETAEEFNESIEFIKEIKFAKIHVFTYSVRSGTIAAEWNHHIEQEIKAKRYKLMSLAAKELRDNFLKSQVGKTTNVLIEKPTTKEFIFGQTPNYTPVKLFACNANRHEILNVTINSVENGYCIGRRI